MKYIKEYEFFNVFMAYSSTCPLDKYGLFSIYLTLSIQDWYLFNQDMSDFGDTCPAG